MRLHRLTMHAFGPFPGDETVDFDALSDSGLFLIHGPTGAGKTSVLDAVCFALYGQVPGARDAAKSPRSSHAPATRAPEVTLTATIRGRRLHISRSPAWERPKRRGTGTTTEKSRVAVRELSGDRWQPVTTRPDEAGRFLRDLLGLSLTQFCQIALLPQGEFARFLHANAKDRRASLERIFATEIFTTVEEWLAEHARELRHEADAAESEVLGVADLIAEHGAGTRPEESGAATLRSWAAELAATTAAGAADLGHIAEDLAERRDRARRELDTAQRLLERQRRHAEALRRDRELRQRETERAEIETRLAAAERAATVVPALRSLEHRQVQWEKAQATATERLSLASGALEGDETVVAPDSGADRAAQREADEAARDRLSRAERTRRDDIVRLERMRDDAQRLTTLNEELERITAEITETRTRHEEVEARLGWLPQRRVELAEELRAARTRAATREVAATALETARQRLSAAQRVTTLSDELERAERERARAVDAAQEAREHFLDVRQRRMAGMAAELAEQLVTGAPCPVCGAVTHPDRATGTAGRPGGDDEEAARATFDAAQERRLSAETAATSLREQHTAAAADAGGLSVAEAEAEVAECEAGLTAATEAAEEEERLNAELAELDAEIEDQRRRAAWLAQHLTEARGRHAARSEEAERLTAELDAARGEDADLSSRLSRLTAEADDLAAADEALRRRVTAVDELAAAETEADHALREAGFVDAEAVWAAHLTAEEREEERRRARAHDDEVAEVRALLADPDLVAASERAEPDIAGLTERLAGYEDEARQAASRHDRFASRAARLARLRDDLDGKLAAWQPARERHATAEGIARLAAGTSNDNRDHVRLSAYVLAARLERVVAAANDRLATMSGRRYELRHTIDQTAGDRSRSGGGLGLRVIDAWTGQERDPATLSGGETFIGSLALALGLGDVAGAEAGGGDIATLFIDEGFGTLDSDTLEEVLNVLDGLRDGGRAVGVVSHVADLRTRITARLRVVKTVTGSRVEQRGG